MTPSRRSFVTGLGALPPVRNQRYRWSVNWRRSYTFIRSYPNDKRRWHFWDAGIVPEQN